MEHKSERKATRSFASKIASSDKLNEKIIQELDKDNGQSSCLLDPLVPELGLSAMLESRLLLT